MKALCLSAALLVISCRLPTPAEEVSILNAELKVSYLKCVKYTLDPKYPRNAAVTDACAKLLKP